MIRFILGLLIAFGAVGTLDYNPDADLFTQTILALFGLTIMYFGARKVQCQ